MTTLREAAQQALEALELGYDSAKSEADQYHAAMAGYKPQRHAQMDADVQQIAKAITALKAALAEPVQEPVAWIYADPDKPGLKFLEWRKDAFGYEGEWTRTPLYATPPQRKPLADEEIRKMFFAELRALPPYPSAIEELPERFARAIERAHGIVPSDCPDSHQPGCDRCRSPLWASTKCDVCGRKA